MKQHGRCFYSGITMTIRNKWTRFSLERLDNTKAHFNEDGTIPDTTVLICRLFSGQAQMSRAKVLTYYLHQQLVTRTDAATARAEEEFKRVNHHHSTCKDTDMVYGSKGDPDESVCEVLDDDSDGDISLLS